MDSGSPASWSEDSNDSINKHVQKVEEKLTQSGHDPLGGHGSGQAKCLLLSSKNLEAEANNRGRAATESNQDLQDVKEVKDLRLSSEQLHNSSQKEPETQSQAVVTAQPSEAENNPTGLLMQQTPIKIEAEGSPIEDYNPAKPVVLEAPATNQLNAAQEQGG